MPAAASASSATSFAVTLQKRACTPLETPRATVDRGGRHQTDRESLMFPVPNGLAPDVGALTEPMAVGRHAVRRGEIGKRDVAIVIGCGPVGLARHPHA